MKNLLLLAILLTSVTSFSRARMMRDCGESKRTSVNLSQLNTAASYLLQEAETTVDSKRALLQLGLISEKANPSELSNEQYAAYLALSNQSLSIMDLIDGSCPSDYRRTLEILQSAREIILSIKKQISK